MTRLCRLLPALLALAALAAAPGAWAKPLLRTATSGSNPKLRTCHSGLLPTGSNVKAWKTSAADTGLLTARLDGSSRGDWDIAVFGSGGRFVAAAAGPTSSEIASGFVVNGEPLTVQACLVRGRRSSVEVGLSSYSTAVTGAPEKVQILSVHTPTQDERNRLMSLGFDDSHSGGKDTLDIVVSGAAEIQKLRNAGFEWTVREPDLVALERRRAKLDLQFKQSTARSALPSGRTEYRHLADYEAEMKALAEKNPGLVKLISMPNKSLEGRTVLGVEIAQNVNVKDGKPVFLQVGIHHAREWPAAEHPMEWAYELVKGYGKSERVTRLVDATRTIVVPVMNPDGFNLSREAPVDAGNALAMIDLPPDIDDQLPVQDPTYVAALLADQNAAFFAYKRRNCRVKDGEVPDEGECAARSSRVLGVDPNRNYGGFWGGRGASLEPTNDTYRGEHEFSEPEVRNIRETISTNQVVTMITNHTFSNLILRPPGVKSEGTTPDEPVYKAFADAMAANNGYKSIHGYGLYDTTGTTEDWSYFATGGFGFTFEIGPDEFHPPFEEMVAEYDGAGDFAGKGNREAYFVAQEHTATAAHHSVLRGKAPAGTVLRLHKEFMSQTSPVIKEASGATERPHLYKDVLDTTMEVGDGGSFTWHVNPSTRPFVRKDRTYSDVADVPASEEDISSPVPVPPGVPRHVEFEVKADAARQIRAAITGAGPDYDIYLYEGEVKEENQVGSSAGPDSNETIVVDFPNPGKYILEIENYSAVSPYDGAISVFGEAPGSIEVTKATEETWTLTCERRDGSVFATRKVSVDRGQVNDLGNACSEAQGTAKGLKLGLKLRGGKRQRGGAVAARGLRAVATCSRRCTAVAFLKADGRTAKRLKAKEGVLGRTKAVKFRGKRTLAVKVRRKFRSRLRRSRGATVSLVVVARDALGNAKTRSARVKLR